jgi:hypothetical protein
MTTRKIDTKAIAQSSTTYVGRVGEIFYDTSTNTLRISNGITAGGLSLNLYNSGTNQGPQSINIGNEITGTLVSNQGSDTIAIGVYAGTVNQGTAAIAIGETAGANNQGVSTVAIGALAASTNQGVSSVAVGALAGNASQGVSATAVGAIAGATFQQEAAVAIGATSGNTLQGVGAVAIGTGASPVGQGAYSIAIGKDSVVPGTANAGGSYVHTTEGSEIFTCTDDLTSFIGSIIGCIAFPSGTVLSSGSAPTYVASNTATQTFNGVELHVSTGGQHANSIVLNASGTPIAANQSALYVAPVRSVSSLTIPDGFYNMAYNPTTKEIIYWS